MVRMNDGWCPMLNECDAKTERERNTWKTLQNWAKMESAAKNWRSILNEMEHLEFLAELYNLCISIANMT